jgi:acetyl esterase/lipase
MTSLRSKLIIGLIKHRHLFKFKLRPEVVDENFSVQKFRDDIDRVSIKMKLPKDVHTEKLVINGINSEWIIPPEPADNKVLLYIHGGGFISGSCLTHRMHVAKFAIGCGLKSLVFDYRLAPEHPFPAALEDCIAIYKWLLHNGYQAENIIIGGESAGGTLTLSLLLALKENNTPLPKAAFSISPVTDLQCKAASFDYNFKNDIAPKNSWLVWTNFYIADNNPKNPFLSPLFGNYQGIPPLYICVGTHEIHLEDCINVASVAQQAGVNVTLRTWKKMVHAFPILTPLFPEAKQAFEEICAFVKSHL